MFGVSPLRRRQHITVGVCCPCEKCHWENTWIAIRGGAECEPKEIAKLKDDIQQASSPEQKARLETNLQQAQAYLEELQQLKPALPTRTVASSVTLQEPGREIQLLLLGRGHTDGDVYIYLPKEKVVVTGDALVDWMPFLNDGYPEEWVQTFNGPRTV